MTTCRLHQWHRIYYGVCGQDGESELNGRNIGIACTAYLRSPHQVPAEGGASSGRHPALHNCR
jgi:hypothetical protein